jgi:hypothetical protein
MPAFKVHLNGKKVCTASLDGLGVLAAHVSYVCRKDACQHQALSLHVGGLDSTTGEHIVWHEAHPIRVGDKLSIEIVESARADKPVSRKKRDPAADLRARKKYVRIMAKELGWKIQTK